MLFHIIQMVPDKGVRLFHAVTRELKKEPWITLRRRKGMLKIRKNSVVLKTNRR